jgi:hypothetical protein
VEERTEETRDAQAASVASTKKEPDEFQVAFYKWLSDTVGITPSFGKSLDTDDDWTYVIKMHAFLEAALNHLVLGRLKQPLLNDFVTRLETNDRRTGKLAVIKAFNLLTDNAIMFVRLLSEVRNRAVHDIKNFDLNLTAYIGGLDQQQKKNWKAALTSWHIQGAPSQEILDFSIKVPRNAIYNSCMMIMIRSFAENESLSNQYQRYLREAERKRAESTPTK